MSESSNFYITNILKKLFADSLWLQKGYISPSLRSSLSHKNKEINQLFLKWATVDFNTFQQFILPTYLKKKLQNTNSSPSNNSLFDLPKAIPKPPPSTLKLCLTLLNTPQTKQQPCLTTNIHYGMHQSPFGRYLLATNQHGQLCSLHFLAEEQDNSATIIAHIQRYWAAQTMIFDPIRTQKTAQKIQQILQKGETQENEPLEVILKGTAFQLKTWQTLLFVSRGDLISYGDLAQKMGLPKSTARAVGTAVGKNEIAYLIPCHRVLPSTGRVGHYRWGQIRKVQMIGWEATR